MDNTAKKTRSESRYNWLWVVAWLLLNVADCLLTDWLVKGKGWHELNPGMAWALDTYIFFAVKYIVPVLVVIALWLSKQLALLCPLSLGLLVIIMYMVRAMYV
jgi:hypothetical protein